MKTPGVGVQTLVCPGVQTYAWRLSVWTPRRPNARRKSHIETSIFRDRYREFPLKLVALNSRKLKTGEAGSWAFCDLRFDDSAALTSIAQKRCHRAGIDAGGPVFWVGVLEVSGPPADTYLHFGAGWERGIVFVNGFNLGRYDLSSPQHDLYVPAPVLRCKTNELLILEAGESAVWRTDMGPVSFKAERTTRT